MVSVHRGKVNSQNSRFAWPLAKGRVSLVCTLPSLDGCADQRRERGVNLFEVEKCSFPLMAAWSLRRNSR